MSTKHTPWPWVVNPTFRSPGVGYDVGDGGEPLPIPNVVHGDGKAQARANARLIAAAPELLEACVMVEQAQRDGTYEVAFDAVRAAIAKAEGRA